MDRQIRKLRDRDKSIEREKESSKSPRLIQTDSIKSLEALMSFDVVPPATLKQKCIFSPL